MKLSLYLGAAAVTAVFTTTAAFGVSGDDKITTIAGNGKTGSSGDGGPATSARLTSPRHLAIDRQGNVYIADQRAHRVRRVSADGEIATFAGNGTNASYPGTAVGDGGPASSAQLDDPIGVAVDSRGNVYITSNYRVRKVSPDGKIMTFAGTRGVGPSSGDGGPATAARLFVPHGVVVDSRGNVYIADGNATVRKVGPDGTITTFAGGGSSLGDGGPATAAKLRGPDGVAVDSAGNVYIADQLDHRVRKVSPDGKITTIAGTGKLGFSGDGGPATSARLAMPRGVAVDGQGSVYIVDYFNQRVRKVSPNGKITTFAGTGKRGFSGDGGPARAARLLGPEGIAVDSEGSVYITDCCSRRVRKVTNALPIPSFTLAPASGPAPLTVRLDASASRDPSGSVVSYAWDFGDGTTGAGKKTSHTFAKAGSFNVTLRVTDDSGGSRTKTRVVRVA